MPLQQYKKWHLVITMAYYIVKKVFQYVMYTIFYSSNHNFVQVYGFLENTDTGMNTIK